MLVTPPLHPEELALLRAVCAEPEDDTPRLVLADWYDEQDDPVLNTFAAFIRLHIQDARSETVKSGDGAWEGTAAWKRERAKYKLSELLHLPNGDECAGNAWAARLFAGSRVPATGYTRPEKWQRGFPAFAAFGSYANWGRAAGKGLHPDRLYERVPLVRSQVDGRRPSASNAYPAIWRWRRGHIYTGGSNRGEDNLPPVVYDWLTVEHGLYNHRSEAVGDAERAFTDAGRVACGLSPRHKKPQPSSPSTEPAVPT